MGSIGESNVVNGTNGIYEDIALPNAKSYSPQARLTLQPPLTRRGHGPGLILIVPEELDVGPSVKTLDPPPLQKWAEEGFVVAQVTLFDNVTSTIQRQLADASKEIRSCDGFDGTDKLGLVSYNVQSSAEFIKAINGSSEIVAVVTYANNALQCQKEHLWHAPGGTPSRAPSDNKSLNKTKTFDYPDADGPCFAVPAHADFRSAAAAVSHTRCLSFLKPLIGGPWFDLEAIWDEHTKFEFGERAVEKTMSTMVQEPYVNHIPTMTGGIGRERLTNFYRHHFIFNNPDDTALVLVSRTVGIDRVIDEFVFQFTHDRMIDWLAPGIPPTGQYCRLPFTSVVNIRGDRLYHEHIGWDQATLLRQLGLMPDYLPFPYAVDGKEAGPDKMFEYRVPTAGADITRKLVDERSLESNEMFDFGIQEVDRK